MEVYQSRLLLYVDVLGWREEIRAGGGARLLDVLHRIHAYSETHNERVRKEYRTRDGERVEIEPGRWGTRQMNPMFFEVQCGAFSDHFAYSVPRDFGGRILTAATKLVVDLLHMGFLTRGAIVLGDLHHRDNVIFGPALIEAYEIESKEAFYPRVIISRAVIEELGEGGDDGLIIEDGSGRHILNPFWLPFTVDDPTHDHAAVESFVHFNFHLTEIKSSLERNIARLESEGRTAHAEKWHYMRRLIEGPVLDAVPRLRPFWK
jgi:hypothetical protein